MTPKLQQKKRTKKWLSQEWAIRLLLIFISLCAALLLFEGAVRILPPPYAANSGTIFTCHHSLGWQGEANLHETFATEHFNQNLRFNSSGMHDTEHSLKKPADTFRILMLGDSFVQAIQVAEPATAHQVLEDTLNQGGKGQFEVISGGVVNWGTNQQLLYYRDQGQYFQPDLVLLMFYIGNDFLDNLPGNVLTVDGVNCYAPYLAVCEDKLHPAPLAYAPGFSQIDNNCQATRRMMLNGFGWLYQHSRLYQQLDPLIISRTPRQIFGEAYASPFSALYLPQDEATLRTAWTLTEATIQQLKQEVEANGSRLAVGLISPEITVRLAALSPSEREAFLRDNPAFAAAEIDRPNQRLAQFLTGQNIPFTDLTRPLVEQTQQGNSELYLIGDGHWTEAGNRVAGEHLAQWVIQQSFIQP